MKKMGYRGGGLGKHEQGEVNEIQISTHYGHTGLGFEFNPTVELLIDWDRYC